MIGDRLDTDCRMIIGGLYFHGGYCFSFLFLPNSSSSNKGTPEIYEFKTVEETVLKQMLSETCGHPQVIKEEDK